MFAQVQQVGAGSETLVITADMQLEYATKLFNNKDYETAMVEFKRFAHFFPNDERTETATFKTGLCHYHLGDFPQAARVLNQIIIQDKDNEITKEAVFFQSRAFVGMRNWGYAQIALQN